MAAVYEDIFGYYDLEADPDEAAFFAFVKSQSKPRKSPSCSEPVKVQPGPHDLARSSPTGDGGMGGVCDRRPRVETLPEGRGRVGRRAAQAGRGVIKIEVSRADNQSHRR